MKRSITGIPELRESHRQLGPRRFWTMMLALISLIFGWAALGIWLKTETGWPERYGFHCHGRGCLFVDMWHSPALLSHLDVYQIGLFLWIWSIPLFAIISFLWVRWRKQTRAQDLSAPKIISDPE